MGNVSKASANVLENNKITRNQTTDAAIERAVFKIAVSFQATSLSEKLDILSSAFIDFDFSIFCLNQDRSTSFSG
jgi:hypothetical protein